MASLEQILGEVLPEGTSATTPSGLTIFFCPEPRHYKVNGQEVPSVTKVLEILHKPQLLWWSQKIGLRGFMSLAEMEDLARAEGGEYPEFRDAWLKEDVDALAKELTKHKITVNHVRDAAGTRGTSVHMAFERWADGLGMPDPESYPEEERGYVRGLVSFIEAVKPDPVFLPDGKVGSEVMVGSARKGFAGRFDLLALTPPGVVHPTPRKSRVIPEGFGIWDLKTGKGIYPDSHFLQLAAYRFAYEESYSKKGNSPARVDYEAIVNVREDGSWDVGISDRQPWQFLAVKTAWEALQ